MSDIAANEPHVHFPSNCLTIAGIDPETDGIRCKHCNVRLEMTGDEFFAFVRYWVFDRFATK